MLKISGLYISQLIRSWIRWPSVYWQENWLHRVLMSMVLIIVVLVGSMYGIAQWYIQNERFQPLKLGVSFIPDYAESLGLNPQQTMDGLLGIGVRHFRLVSYWSDMEPSAGRYDFSQLDWEFQKAEAAQAKITLSIGLRQPRWPECHMPDWAAKEPVGQWQPQLEQFMRAVIDRYKNSPSLDSYQLENEYFLQGFGLCTNMDRQRLVDEYNLIKKSDPDHKVIVSRSNNALGIPIGQPKPGEYGISVYKRVWDAKITHRYIEYPIPAWFYGFLAGAQKLHDGNDMIIHELQSEAWAPDEKSISQISLAEQNKSLNAQRLRDRFQYGKATGIREIYMWGAEYWYYRLVVLHDPSLWNVAQQEFQQP